MSVPEVHNKLAMPADFSRLICRSIYLVDGREQ